MVVFIVLDLWVWSGRQDLNLRPPHPQCGALPDCATPRVVSLESLFTKPALIRIHLSFSTQASYLISGCKELNLSELVRSHLGLTVSD